MLTAFKQYLLTLKLSRISRKLYLSDVVKFLSSLGTDPGLDLVTDSSSYLEYLETLRSQAVAPSMIKRITASLRQFATFIALTYAVPNPLTKLQNTISIPEDKYIKHFTNYLNREQLSPLTIKSYKSDTSLFLDWVHTNLPSTKISEVLSENNIEKYLNYLRQSQTSSISTIERKSKSLARFKVWYLNNYAKNQLPDNTNTVSVEPLPVQLDNSLAINNVADPVSILPPVFVPDKKKFSVKNFNYRTALSFFILMLFAATLGIFGYRQFSRDVRLTAAYPSTPVTPSRTLSFQGRLENAGGTPITTATNLTFKLYDDLTAGTQLYSTGVCSITPDADGVFSTQIGSTCGSSIASSVFTENANVWLEVTVAAEILTPRQPIASVAYALNSETLQGFPISSTVSAIRNTVVPMNEWGEIIVGEQNPRMKGVSGTFQISAPSLSFITTTGSNGNINFAPDGTGQINATGNTTTTNFFNVLNSQLTTGSLITGTVANNNTGFKLIDLLSGSSPTSKFSVSDAGNTTIAGTLTLPNTNTLTGVSGYTQFSQGVSVGGGTTYYINSSGTGNLNALTLAGTLTANGQVNLGDGGDAITLNGTSVTFTGVDCTSYTNGGALTTNGSGVLQCSDDDGGGAGTGSNWRSNLGTLSPLNDTWDLLIGGNATSSAKAGFININSGTPTATVSAGTSGGAYLSASGTLATTAKQTLSIGNSTTGNINIGVGSGDLLIGESGTAVDIHFAETANIEADPGKVISLSDIGNITPDADSTYSLGANATSAWLNIYGDNIYQNGNLVCDASGANCPATGTNYWRSNLGSLSPISDSYDLLLGADATSSAKAGFININSGTPTATVSAGTAGGSFITANGYLSATARQSLTLGNSSSYNTTGNILLNPNGIGKIGIGTTNPGYTLDINTTSSSRALNLNNVQTGSSDIYGVYGSANVTDGTYTASSYGGYFTANQTSGDNSIGIYAEATGTDVGGSLYGVMGQALDGTGVYGNGNTGGNFNGIAAGLLASANTTVNPVGISVTAQGDLTPITAQLYTTKTGTTATDTYGISNVVLNPTIVTSGNDRTYGEYNVVDRISATGGTIETYGSYIGVTGDNAGSGTHTAYGLYVNMGAGPDNVYASIFDGGNVGIGDTTPDAPLDIVGDVYISDGLSLYETIVSDGTIEATKFCTGDGETNCVTDFSSLIGGSSIWTDAGSYLYLSAGEVLGNPSSGGINKLDGIYLDDTSPLVFGGDNDFTFAFNNTTSTLGSTLTSGTRFGINTDAALATLDVRSSLGTIPVASISGNTSMTALIVDQSGSGDIFTASSSGETRFVVKSNGNVGVGVADPTNKLEIGGSTSTISNAAGDITLDSASNNISFAGDSLINLLNLYASGELGVGISNAIGTFHVHGATVGKALTILNELGDQDILVASASGSTRARLTNNGSLSLDGDYLNFGLTEGSSGYGFRDNGGTLQFKHNSGSWADVGSGGASVWVETAGVLSPTTLGNVIAATTSATTALTITQTGAFNALLIEDQSSDTTPFVIDQSGNVGIGVATPTQKLEVAGYIVGQRFEDSANSTFFVDPAATGTSISIDGNIVSDGAFSITSNATNGNITIDAGSGTVLIGSAGAGKLDAGTIDPPYTINGEKFATYMAGMTGVKEETTGLVKASEFIPGKGYRATLDFAGSLTGSDLWLFSKASNIKSHLDKLVVLLSSSNSGKTWYELDALAGKLHLYSQNPGNISYRLTAPRYDDTAWLNTRDDSSASIGHVINDDNNWSISQELANLFSNPEMVSPSTGDRPTTINSPLVIKPESISSSDPALVVDGEILASTVSARLAQLDVVSADLITAKNIVADTITANTIIGLDARIASLSGMTDQQFDSITERIKNRLSSLISPTPTAQDIPTPEITEDFSSSSFEIATASATISSADIDFATVNNYLAVIGEATITTLSVTNGLYVDSIDSKSGKIALASGTLLIDSAGQVAINGDLTVSGNILADSGSFGTLELGSPKDATSSTALGNLLSVYDESGNAVATIDASGSANLASLTTNMITIASPAIASESSGLANLLGTATSNATAGENILVSPNTELTINSPFVTADSLIYLTPTTNTDNKVVFVKSKNSCNKIDSQLVEDSVCIPSFTVAIDAPASSDISFNWWIIELARPKESGL